ncbi:MAG: hypothetical protein KQH79_14570 [Bacteroidetes bacterium]|nr:hypothetical protein [Bacteroidota bacterium]
MRKILFFILFILIWFAVKSQNLNNVRSKNIDLISDTLKLDSLLIVPGSEILTSGMGTIIPDTLYYINYSESFLILDKDITDVKSPVKIIYRVFPSDFSKSAYSRKKENIVIAGPVMTKASTTFGNKNNFFNDNQLDKRGSIARGITVGNNQDAVINSNLNLQVSGKISNEMQIMAAISDENIPIQPDGNSQQIQDFDKVFIQIYNDNTKLIAGDFEITKPTGYFMNVNKKAQGGLLNTNLRSKKDSARNFETTISGAVSKGKYCRKTFQGQEGNQGPYKLTGCENEQYIIVLAGTENVFIDGKQIMRGKDNDYVIDYNTGELTFTANRPITKDSRIAVEFEYTERSYARFAVYSTNEFTTNKGKFWLNIFSEQDSKNQPINQDLTSEQKQLLSEAGDSIANAYIENADSVNFRSDYVLYEKLDTIFNGTNYTIYKYSTDPTRAIYQVGFNLVGVNKGNYIKIQSAANGKVYEWVAPESGVPQGNYEPVRLLISPKKQQMVSLGSEYNLGDFTKTYFEVALSNYDVNTFSSKDAADNVGYAAKFNVSTHILKSDTIRNVLKTKIAYQLINKHFTAIERFRSVEFERDWNLQMPFATDEHNANIGLYYRHKNKLHSNYTFALLRDENTYEGYRHLLNTRIDKQGYAFSFNSSLLNTDSELNSTQFIRYLANFSKSIRQMEIGIENELEQNLWNDKTSDSLLNNSFRFNSYRFYLQNSDSTVNRYTLSYKLRNDYLPMQNSLKQATHAEDFQLGFDLLKNPSSVLRTKATYRRLEVLDTTLISDKEENTITGRLDYTLRIFKGAISSSTFYEAGSGLEPKREYSYLKVANGQGIYNWEDYNNNGIAELDEFEIAQFQDQASYIRVYTPGSEYLKTYTNEFSQVINIRPETIWRSKSGIRKVMSRFSNNLAYQVNQKSTDDMLEHSLNPFYSSNADTTVINLNQNVRNTLSFNRTSSKFGVDYIFQQSSSKVLLSNGFDNREKQLSGIRLRWNFISDFIIQNYFEWGNKEYISEYFSVKNYDLLQRMNEVKLQYEPGFQAKVELNYTYKEKSNQLASEESFSNDLGLEINYSLTNKGNVLAQANYLNIKYNADSNTSIAYEMLQGLKPGNNATWNLTFQRKLAGFVEMNLIYNGRWSEGYSTIHMGSIQLRAFF